jgi:hypothetical protein
MQITNITKGLQQSALVMKALGWAMVGLSLGVPIYPPGFMWGSHPAEFPTLVPHPESPYDGLPPYLFMIVAVYMAWGILLIRGSKDPKANAALFDFGILANLLHGLVMLVQAFIYPNEHAHLWADVPLAFAISAICWIYHPNRLAPETLRV